MQRLCFCSGMCISSFSMVLFLVVWMLGCAQLIRRAKLTPASPHKAAILRNRDSQDCRIVGRSWLTREVIETEMIDSLADNQVSYTLQEK